jgi:hypothetical protein
MGCTSLHSPGDTYENVGLTRSLLHIMTSFSLHTLGKQRTLLTLSQTAPATDTEAQVLSQPIARLSSIRQCSYRSIGTETKRLTSSTCLLQGNISHRVLSCLGLSFRYHIRYNLVPELFSHSKQLWVFIGFIGPCGSDSPVAIWKKMRVHQRRTTYVDGDYM